MELLDVPIKLRDYKKPLYVHLIGDIHRSAVGCDHVKLRRDIEKIRARAEAGEEHRWLGGGDWANAIGPKDRRYDNSVLAPEFRQYEGDSLFQAEARILAKEFEPIKHLGIAVGAGNHETAISRSADYNPALDVAERLNLPYIGYSALIRFRVSAANCAAVSSVIMFWHHGRGSARSKGSKVNALHSFRDIVQADVYAAGHDHELSDWPEVRLEGSRKGEFKLIKRDCLFVNQGTYLKAYPTEKRAQKSGKFNEDRNVHNDYAEVAAYRPNVVGHNGFRIMLDTGCTRTGSGGFKLLRWECRWD